MKTIAIIISQVVILFAINEAGNLIVDTFNLKLPGSLIGIVILFVLLSTNAIRLNWIEKTAVLFLNHLSLFFVPFALGILVFDEFFSKAGLVLLWAISLSVLVGCLMASFIFELLLKRGDKNE